MKREKKLAVQLTIRIGCVLLIIFALLIAAVAANSFSSLRRREMEKLELLARENANIVKDYMESMIHKQECIVAAIETMEGENGDKARQAQRLLEKLGAQEKDILGLFFVSEPNQFLQNTPDGWSASATAGGVHTRDSRFDYVTESIYREALQNGGLTIADPHTKTIDGHSYTVITVLLPVHNAQGEAAGMVGSNIDVQVLLAAPYDRGGYTSFQNEIICGHKTVILHSGDAGRIGKPYGEVSASRDPSAILQAAVDAKTLTLLDAQKEGGSRYAAYIPFYVGTAQVPWLSGISISQGEFQGQIVREVLAAALASLLGLAMLILYCLFTIRRTLRPLSQVEQAARRMNEGDLGGRIGYAQDDEIGRLAGSLNQAMDTLSAYIRDIGRAMGEMSNGNFDVTPAKPFMGDFKDIETSISHFILQICQALGQMTETAQSVMTGSEQLAEGSAQLSQGATEQAAALEQLGAAIDLLAGHVRANDEAAQEAGRRVREAAGQLERSSARTREMSEAMDLIYGHANEIQRVIKTIQDIAFQTNILALNASVEAARAGEAGQGFAVVASEVRSLANKSSEAAKSTTQMIGRVLGSIASGVELAKQADGSLTAVREKAASVQEIVDAICVSSQQQMEEITRVSTNADQIAAVVHTNTAAAEETAATSQQLSSQAQLMREMASRFRLSSQYVSKARS